MTDPLSLPEELALLLIHTNGGLAVTGQTVDVGLAGAALADLALRGQISLAGKHVTPIAGPPSASSSASASASSVLPSSSSPIVDEPVLDAVLGHITGSTEPRTAKWWVASLGKRPLRDEVIASLVRRGILREERRAVLGIFPSTRFPERDGAAEARLRSDLAAVLSGGATPTPRLATLVGLLDATGTLGKQFPGTDRRLVKEIIAGDWAAPAVRAVLQDVQAAAFVMLAATSTAATAGVIASS